MRLAILPLACLLILSLSGSGEAFSKASMHTMRYQPPPLPVPKDARAVAEHWITQKLDHFDTSNRKTFQMVRKCDEIEARALQFGMNILC
jgi:hypothetical protein